MQTAMTANGEQVVTVEKLNQKRIARFILTLSAEGKVVRFTSQKTDGTTAADREFSPLTQDVMTLQRGIVDGEQKIVFDGTPKLFQNDFAADDWAALVALCTK